MDTRKRKAIATSANVESSASLSFAEYVSRTYIYVISYAIWYRVLPGHDVRHGRVPWHACMACPRGHETPPLPRSTTNVKRRSASNSTVQFSDIGLRLSAAQRSSTRAHVAPAPPSAAEVLSTRPAPPLPPPPTRRAPPCLPHACNELCTHCCIIPQHDTTCQAFVLGPSPSPSQEHTLPHPHQPWAPVPTPAPAPCIVRRQP